MTGVGACVRAAVCVGMVAAASGAWLAPGALSAQQREGVPAPPPLGGNVAHGRYIVERVAMCG